MSCKPVRAACVLFLSQLGMPGQGPTVTWRGELAPIESLPGEAQRAAGPLRAWLPFIEENHYRPVLSDDGRVLLVLSEATFARKQPKKEHHEVEVMLGLARDACAVTDRFITPDAKQPAIVVVCARTADYPKLLQFLAKIDPRLTGWTERAGAAVTGFILSDPLVAAWIEDPAGVDEWNPYNELVHRTTQLLIRGRTPQVPAWLLLGLGWHVEDTVISSVYCFPHRAAFVSQGEHTDWGLWLANNFKKDRRKKADKAPVLVVEEFAAWCPQVDKDEFESGKAFIAFGVARYLAHEQAAKLLPLAEQLNAAMAKGSKVMVSDAEWRTDPDYQVPCADQLALLRQIDDGFLAKVTDYFQKRKANERRAPGAKKSRG